MSQHHKISTATIRGLWNNWALAFGSIALVMLCSLFMSKTILPMLLLAIAYALMAKMKSDHARSKMGACYLMLWVMAITIFWSAIVMLVINLLHSKWFFGGLLTAEPFNPKHPYVCSLIIFPIALIVSIYFLTRGLKSKLCSNCQARFGYYVPSNPIATLYYREARYQLRMLLWLSLVLSVVDWTYYYLFYINVNFNKPDKFYFIVMPIAVYLLSLVYMSVRYMSMSDELLDDKSERGLRPMMTVIRFLVLSGDRIFLSEGTDESIDTPAQLIIPRRDRMTADDASKKFNDISGCDEFNTRYLYTDTGYLNGANVLHYAIFLPDDAPGAGKLTGEWCSIDKLDRWLKEGALTPLLAREIHRIYSVTMAWKTYDREGHRIYPIKNYQPTFRLRDFKKWDVDYNDIHWLDVATNNEDRPFFRLRRFWRKNFRH
jgi:hypothetical protein